MSTITVPDFAYAAMYYPEVLEVLIQDMRVNTPEITDEDPAEPFIQILRSVALGSHLNTVLLDMVAKEGFLPTASLRASVKRLLKLIDYELAQASPASADEVIEINGTVTVTTQITAPGAQFSTQATADTPAIPYEDIDGTSIERTDQVTSCQGYDVTGDTYSDHTTEANTGASTFNPGWGAAPEAGDLLYTIHGDVQYDSLEINTTVAASGITGVWEYYDGFNETSAPSEVTNEGSFLRFKINDFLGTSERTGAVIRVLCNLTGTSEDLTSQWDGSNNYVDASGFLGQVTPSLIESDYTISAEWREPNNVTDNTVDFTVTGTEEVTWDLPQDRYRKWHSSTVNGVAGFAIRYRIISVSTPSAPTIDTIDIDANGLYLVVSVTQGVTRADNPLGSSTGLPDQTFTLANFPVIDDESLEVYVDEGAGDILWSRVDNLLSSTSADRHYKVDFDDDGKATIIFGDGTTGKIPPAGVDNVGADYRTMTEVNGNVGPLTINQNQSGSGFIASVWNPRTASGYQPREGATEASLENAKEAGPASLRTGVTASSPEEVETLTIAFVDSDGTRPFTRALAIEEGYGPKTVEVVVVGSGGVAATTAQLTALETYFNTDVVEKQYGVLVANHEATAVNFTPKTIDVTATVYGGSQTSVETALTTLLNPEAVDENGDWQWDFGEEVPLSVIISTIMGTTPKPRKATVTVPASDVTLASKELPVVGTLSITIVP